MHLVKRHDINDKFEKATELLTFIALLHNCHRANNLSKIIFNPLDIIIGTRNENDLPTGLHFDAEVIIYPDHNTPPRILTLTINYMALNESDNSIRCKSPHIELMYWDKMLIELYYLFTKSTIVSILGRINPAYSIRTKYDGPDHLVKIPKSIIWENGKSKMAWGDGTVTWDLQDMTLNYQYDFDNFQHLIME